MSGSAVEIDSRIRRLAQVLWDYHQLRHTLVASDAIMVLCSHDLRVAERGAELFLAGWSPLLLTILLPVVIMGA